MSTLSPDTGDQTTGVHSLNPLSLNDLEERRNVRSDGSQPKKRGPKPGSKPALTRRQELNRQAQRTHRERKELYVKALEDEVLRLKEIYSNVSQDKTKLEEENKLLKDLLSQHGLTPPDLSYYQDPPGDPDHTHGPAPSLSGDSFQYQDSGSSSSAFSPGLASQSSHPSHSSSTRQSATPAGEQCRQRTQHTLSNDGIDYEQAGIDFVLTLERPCMTHLPFMMELAKEQAGRVCGHALMVTCPPEPFSSLSSDSAFGGGQARGEPRDSDHASHTVAQQTWNLAKGDLSTLLDLSAELSLGHGGELTPVTAWSLLMSHPRLSALDTYDFQAIARALEGNIRCYGFGAVTEEFEVRDAIENALAVKLGGLSVQVR